MSNTLLDFLNNEEIDPDIDIFGDSGEEVIEIKSSFQEEKKRKKEEPQYKIQDEDEIYDDLNDNYDVGFEPSGNSTSLFVKVGAICLYAIILFLAIIGALTVMIPNVRMELLATFIN